MKGHEARRFQRSEHALRSSFRSFRSPSAISSSCRSSWETRARPLVEALGNALGEALKGKNVLIVASTDLSHFHDDERREVSTAISRSGSRSSIPRRLLEDSRIEVRRGVRRRSGRRGDDSGQVARRDEVRGSPVRELG